MRHFSKCLGIIALAAFAWGLWIPAKAVAAQILIAFAWQDAVAGAGEPRPWPWADTWPIARLEAPTLGHEVFVLAGASGEAMAFGPGHVSSTAKPGETGNVAIAGHRDTHFAFLAELAPGDPLRLESRMGASRYVVREMLVVHESRTEFLEPTRTSQLTLITCYPFDAVIPGGPLRFVVTAERVDPEADTELSESTETRSAERDLATAYVGPEEPLRFFSESSASTSW